MSEPTYEEIERAYQAAVIGQHPPEAFTCLGSFILQRRPALGMVTHGQELVIDPEKIYLVTKDRIVEA